MLRKIEVSEGSRKVALRFMQMYKRGAVFDAKRPPRLHASAELDALTQDIARSFGDDLLMAAGEMKVGIPTAEILHNSLFLVRNRVGCVVHMGIYDTDTQTSYSLGSRRLSGCYEA